MTVQTPWSNKHSSITFWELTHFHLCDDKVYWLSVYFSDCSIYNTGFIGTFFLAWIVRCWDRLRDWDWNKFIQHNLAVNRCMISDIHDNSYVLFSTNLISNTLHVGRPLLRPFLVGYAEATLPRQQKIAQQTKSVDTTSEYLLWTNGQLFKMNVKIVSSYLQAGKAFDPFQCV